MLPREPEEDALDRHCEDGVRRNHRSHRPRDRGNAAHAAQPLEHPLCLSERVGRGGGIGELVRCLPPPPRGSSLLRQKERRTADCAPLRAPAPPAARSSPAREVPSIPPSSSSSISLSSSVDPPFEFNVAMVATTSLPPAPLALCCTGGTACAYAASASVFRRSSGHSSIPVTTVASATKCHLSLRERKRRR